MVYARVVRVSGPPPFAELIAACAAVHREDPSIRFEFFGCAESEMPRRPSFPYVHHGRLGTPEAVARHLSRCDLLVDPSRVVRRR